MRPVRPLIVMIAVLYVVIGAGIIWNFLIFINEVPHGDEHFYLRQIDAIQTLGLERVMADGAALGFTGPIYLLRQIGLSPLAAGRALSLMAFVAALAAVFQIMRSLNIASFVWRHLAYLTGLHVLAVSSVPYSCISDALLFGLVAWSFVVFWRGFHRDDVSITSAVLSALLLSWALWVRPLALFYIPGAVVGVGLTMRRTGATLQRLATLALMGIILGGAFGLQQWPPLKHHGNIRFEMKALESGEIWIQRNYLALIRKKRRGPEESSRVSWPDVRAYLATHGPQTLPKSISSAFLNNPVLVLESFGRTFFFGSTYAFLRRTGVFFVCLLAGLGLLWRSDVKDLCAVLSCGVLFYVSLVSFCCLMEMAWRWMILPILAVSIMGAKVADLHGRATGLLALAQGGLLGLSSWLGYLALARYFDPPRLWGG